MRTAIDGRFHRRRAALWSTCAVETLEARRMLAVELIKDINPATTAIGTPTWLTDVNGTLFFSTQQKLWKTDGTTAGTGLITHSIWDPQHLIGLNSNLLFNSQGSLFSSDGTESGSFKVTATAMNPRDMVRAGGKVFFRGSDAGGDELWVTDGTAAGTLRLKDIRPGGEGSDPRGLIDVNGRLFFRADDGSSGQELWTSDGTPDGTVRVKDILSGGGSSGPGSFVGVGGLLYFTAYDGSHGYELWRSDGTEAGTTMVLDIRTGAGGSTPVMLQAVGQKVMFLANDGRRGFEIWQSDGTAGGTTLVRDLVRGSAGAQVDNLRSVGSTLYFTADDGSSGHELWKTDGTSAGTVRVKDIAAAAGASSFPGSLTSINGKLFFTANSGGTGQELWTSDGTAAGTVLLRDINPGSGNGNIVSLTASGGQVYFVAQDGTSQALWKTDGTPAGTVLVSRPVVASTGSASMNNALRIGSTIYFAASDGVNGQELWKTDGTPAGTTMVKDLNPGAGGTGISEMINADGTLYFIGNGKIWRSDGTPGGTVTVGANVVSQPLNLTSIGSTVFFRGWSSAGYELWKTDGSDAGTSLLKDINTTSVHASPESMINHNGLLMFVAEDGLHGFELWKSDGTPAGTVMVADINAGLASSGPILLTSIGPDVYFRASDGVHGYELWKSDGTAAGTSMLRDIRAGEGNAIVTSLFRAGGRLFFSADDGVHGQELWTSDGSQAGTVLVSDIYPGKRGSSPGAFADVNGTLFFRADNGASGSELWKSNGSSAGTSMVEDLNAGAAASTPIRIVNVNGIAAFSASDASGYRLWRSDGTPAGTDPIHSTLGFDPVALGDELVFHAWSNWGDEPQKVNVRTTAALTSSASAPPASTTPVPATFTFDGVFRYFDISARTHTPDFEAFGMKTMYSSYIDPYASNYDLSMADETQVRRLAQRAANLNQPVMLDIEHWNVDNRGFSEGTVALSMDRLGQVADWMHDERPDVKLGFATIMPGGNYPAPAPGTPAYAAWQSANDRRQELADKSDFVMPNINPFYADPKAWPTYARAVMAEARRYDKTLVAFMWMHYEFFDPNIILRPQAVEYWRMQLDLARELADGMALWDDYAPWIEDVPWWTVTRDFILTSDALPPAAATNLSATVVDGVNLRLTWTNNAWDAGGYRVERRAWNELDFTTIGGAGPDAPSFTDTSVLPGSDYYYRVVAVNATQDSMPSEPVVARIVLPPATPQAVSATALSSRRVRLTWTESSQDVGGFIVERSSAGGVFATVADLGASVRSFDDDGLAPATLHTYRIRAYNAMGSSGNSATAQATTWPNDTGLRAHWRLDGDALDFSGLAHDGAITGPAAWRTGKLASSLGFDGIDDRITVADASDLRFSAAEDFSVSAWVNLPTLLNRRTSAIAKSRAAGAWYGIGLDQANRWTFGGAAGELVGTVASTGWTHVAAVQDGVAGQRKLYVNGVLVASGASQPANGTGPLWIGAAESVGEFFAGDIDDVRIYGKALSAAHASALASPFVTLNSAPGGTQWTLQSDATGANVEFISTTAPTFTRPGDTVATIEFIAGSGNDTLILDNTTGDVLPTYAVNFVGSGGTDTLDFHGHAPTDAFGLDASRLWQGERAVNFGSVESIRLSDATFAVTSSLGPLSLSVASGAAVTVAAPQRLSSLAIAGGLVKLVDGGAATLATDLLSVSDDGMLDLADNDLILNYASTSPIGTWAGDSYTGVQGMLASGRVQSSSASLIYALHAGEASNIIDFAGGQTATWSGQTVDQTTVLVKFTYAADANLDGVINIDDYTVIDANVALALIGPGQFNGDFNLDGEINIDDYTIIDSVFAIQGPPL